MVGLRGFEPPTTRPPGECATGLRYSPTVTYIIIYPIKPSFVHKKKGGFDAPSLLSHLKIAGDIFLMCLDVHQSAHFFEVF